MHQMTRAWEEKNQSASLCSYLGLVPASLPGSVVTASSLASLFASLFLCPTVSTALLNHNLDHGASFKAFHRLPSDLGHSSSPWPRPFQVELDSGLRCLSPICPPVTLAQNTSRPLSCIAHVLSQVLARIIPIRPSRPS